MRTLQEIADYIEKMMDEARGNRRNHAYIKGLRDARKEILYELGEYDDDSLPES